jgi:hypothetical protein
MFSSIAPQHFLGNKIIHNKNINNDLKQFKLKKPICLNCQGQDKQDKIQLDENK